MWCEWKWEHTHNVFDGMTLMWHQCCSDTALLSPGSVTLFQLIVWLGLTVLMLCGRVCAHRKFHTSRGCWLQSWMWLEEHYLPVMVASFHLFKTSTHCVRVWKCWCLWQGSVHFHWVLCLCVFLYFVYVLIWMFDGHFLSVLKMYLPLQLASLPLGDLPCIRLHTYIDASKSTALTISLSGIVW